MYSFLTYSGGITQANRNGPRAALYSSHNCKRDCVTKCVYELTMAARLREFRENKTHKHIHEKEGAITTEGFSGHTF